MDVRIYDYGKIDEDNYFICYQVSHLSLNQMNYLNENLDEKTTIEEDVFKIKMNFNKRLYPFQSDAAKFRLDDFIAREEIEMNVFLSGFLEDM